MRIVDLTVPIEPHFRWPMERSLKSDFARGDPFQVTWLGLVVHGFTHIDSPRHMVPDGPTSSQVPLEATIGEAAVIRLDDAPDNVPIDADVLVARGAHVRPGDIVLLRTRWDERRRLHSPEFWTEAPWLTRAACTWLLDRGIKALAPDFPQDYPIRGLLGGRMAPMEEFVSHDVLLRNGVILIEYVCNFGALRTDRPTVYALPLKLPESDGCPARVIAVEPD
ncbi:cyclase family protein [Elioraea tepidiphila]|jgi:kynurenine formamidase|uniref:cyclase family protein n=1 Tax=Elioraea tepidiphila TaxID=457934 RepID=UPI002FD8DC95